MAHTTEQLLYTTEALLRQCYEDCDARTEAAPRSAQVRQTPAGEDMLLDLPAIASAFSRRLRDAGMPVTPSQSEQYARSLDLTRPASRHALYWTTRAVFVTGRQQVATFDRVFGDIFGAVARNAFA